MNAHRLLSARLFRPATPRSGTVARAPAWPAWSDTQPMCFRSEAFAEDLPDLARGRALVLQTLPQPAHGTARSGAAALWAASLLAAVLGALALGLGGYGP